MFGSYLRLRVHVSASDLDVIRAARRKIVRKYRTARDRRDARHAFYRAMLGHHHHAQDLAQGFYL